MDETEFEEGEDCYYMDNSRVDPDIALSYIDDKLQNVLGHFQKDFEGGVSAENLGTKFGGYGSFLPTHQRSPSIWAHPKNSKGVQNFSSQESLNVLPLEGAPMATAQSTRVDAPRSFPLLNTAISPSPSIYDKKVSRLSSDQGKKFLVKQEPVSNKKANSSDQRTLKVRIKLNSDNAAKSKAAIYSGFGLNTTPSSSMGNSEDSSGMPSQCAGTIDESPSNILQIMTSFPVPGGSLLSPLIGSLLCLEMKEKLSQTSSPKATKKVSKEKKRRVVVKKENTVLSSGKIGMNLGDRTIPMKPEVDIKVENTGSIKVENTGSETQGQGVSFLGEKNPNHMPRNKNGADMEHQVCKEVRRNVLGKKMEDSKSSMEEMLSFGPVRVESLESVSDHNGGFEKRDFRSSTIEKISESRSNNYCKDELVDVTRNVQSRRNEANTMSKADSGVSNCGRDLKDEVKLTHGVEMSSSKGKKKLKKPQNSVDLASEAEGSLVSGSLEVPKRKKKSGEVYDVKLQDDIKLVHGNSKALQPNTTEELVKKQVNCLQEGPSGHGASKSDRGVVEKKQGLSLNKVREISTQRDMKAIDGDLSYQVGLVSVVEPTSVAMIADNWVQCDRCDKWRLLPYGTNAEQLPEKWVCRMLNWLPGMNRCEFSEDETTQALHRLYQPECQTNVTNNVDRIVPCASLADMYRLNPSSNVTLKTKPKLKETHCAASNGGSVLIPGSVKSFQQDVVKSRSLNDMNPKLFDEKNTREHEEKHEKSGAADEKKLKSKRAAGPDEHGTPKRTRVDVASDAVKSTKKVSSSGILEGELQKPELSEMKTYDDREISLKKRKLKDWQESQDCIGVSKDDGNHRNKRMEFIKEETCDSEFRKIKNSAMSNVEGNEIILHKGGGKLRSVDKVTKLKNPVHGREEAYLLSDQILKPATSSSSKVSNSLKSERILLEVKGSPVESVSSSPIRNSNLEQLSPSRRGNLRKNASKKSNILTVNSAKKSSNMESNTELNQSVTARNLKVSRVSHSESPGFPPLDFRDNNKGQKSVGKSRVREESPGKFRGAHMVKNESEKLESSCPGDLQLLDGCHSDDKSNKNHNNDSALLREKSRKGSSLLSKGKDGSSGSNLERIKKASIRPSAMLVNPKESLRDDGVKIGPNDLKCRIKLVRDDKVTRETPQQDQIQGFNDGAAIKSDIIRKESTRGSSLQAVPNHVAKKDPPAQIPPSVSGSHKGNVFDVVPADSSCSSDPSKVPKQCNNASSPVRNDASSQSNAAFEEAEGLKTYGDRLKTSGFPVEGNDAHFKAVLYFLHAASLRESCSYDSNKHGEMSPVQIYSTTAKICELCALEFEKRNDLATAALAYKCVEVAYLRVVYFKNSTAIRDRHDLQAIVPQGESPSSSASDVDSLNNQVMGDKAALSKTVGSHVGNHIIVSHNRPNFVRLLDFLKDVNSAMEASSKSKNTFAAASHKLGQNNAGIVSVKRVTDFSFQDVDELIRLVRAALESISRQGLHGNKV